MGAGGEIEWSGGRHDAAQDLGSVSTRFRVVTAAAAAK